MYLQELLNKEALVKKIISNINRERNNKSKPIKDQLNLIDNELDKLERKKKKIFEAYEDEIITKQEFQERKEELNLRVEELYNQREELMITINEDIKEEVSYELVKSILENFAKILQENTEIEKQKKLLHMIIYEITINDKIDIYSIKIKIKINDSIIDYLSKEGISIKGIPSSFIKGNLGLNKYRFRYRYMNLNELRFWKYG